VRLTPLALWVLAFTQCAMAQSPTVAFTVDDLPFVRSEANHRSLRVIEKEATAANRRLLAAFQLFEIVDLSRCQRQVIGSQPTS
jgi:hypothetical protein